MLVTLEMQLKPSRLCRPYLIGIAALLLINVVIADLDWFIKSLAAGLVIFLFVRQAQKLQFVRVKYLAQNHWQLLDASGNWHAMDLLGSSRRFQGLCILAFKPQKRCHQGQTWLLSSLMTIFRRTYHVPIWRDSVVSNTSASVASDDFRHLQWLLKFPPKELA